MIINDRRPGPDLYRLAASTLGVQPGADQDQVRKAYRKAAHKFHPDQHVGEGKDAIYSARFHLATAAKSLLLARGSADERKALVEFNKAKASFDETLRKAGVSLASLDKAEAPARPSSPSPNVARPQTAGSASSARAAHADAPRTSGAAAGSASKPEGEGLKWKKWVPPDFAREAPGWSSARQETRAAEPSRPTQEAPRPSASTSAFRTWSFEVPSTPPAATSETARAASKVDLPPVPSATQRVQAEGAAAPVSSSRMQNAARAYAQTMEGPAPRSRLDRWA